MTETCDLRAGHAGQHESTDGSSWTRGPDTEAEAELCATVARLEAKLAATQGRLETAWASLDEHGGHVMSLHVRLARMRPVYDAAVAWAEAVKNPTDPEPWDAAPRSHALIAAVDQTAPSSPQETPHTADDGEAGVVEGAGGSEAAEGVGQVPVPEPTGRDIRAALVLYAEDIDGKP